MSEPIHGPGNWPEIIAHSAVVLNRAIAVYLSEWSAGIEADAERAAAAARGLKLAADDLNLILDDVGVESL